MEKKKRIGKEYSKNKSNVKRASKYEKKPQKLINDTPKKIKKENLDKNNEFDLEKEEIEKSIRTFDPYYNEQSRIYDITCFVCKKEKKVAIKPIDGVPVICDDCMIDLEAKRLLDLGGMQKTQKLTCKWCNSTFYGLNDSYLFCNDCYDKFSHEIKARRKGLISCHCDICNKETWIPKKIMEIKKENKESVYCKDCMLELQAKEKQEKRKNRIQMVKNRLKNKE